MGGISCFSGIWARLARKDNLKSGILVTMMSRGSRKDQGRHKGMLQEAHGCFTVQHGHASKAVEVHNRMHNSAVLLNEQVPLHRGTTVGHPIFGRFN